jgi:transposase
MEACRGAHHLGRLFAAQGHDVRLMSPDYARAGCRPNTRALTSRRGTTTIAMPRASPRRRAMRCVAVKTEAQRDLQTPHRSRDRRVGERTALINPFRAIPLARGIIVPLGKRKRERDRVTLREEREAGPLTARMRMLVADMRARWRERDRRIAAFAAAFVAFAKKSDDARRLATIPGVGAMTATARIAAIGKAAIFAPGRRCLMARSKTRLWGDGPRSGSPVLIRMSPSWRSPTSWRASPRRFRDMGNILRQGGAHGGIAIGPTARLMGCRTHDVWRRKRDGLTVERRSGNLV